MYAPELLERLRYFKPETPVDPRFTENVFVLPLRLKGGVGRGGGEEGGCEL